MRVLLDLDRESSLVLTATLLVLSEQLYRKLSLVKPKARKELSAQAELLEAAAALLTALTPKVETDG